MEEMNVEVSEDTTTSEGQDNTGEQGKQEPAKASAPSPKKTYEFQVNKEIKKLELDDNEVKQLMQKGLSATETWKEAKRMKEESLEKERLLESFFDDFAKNPRETIKKHPRLKNVNMLTVSEEELLEHLQDQAKTPEQKQAEEDARLAKMWREKEQKEKEEKAKAEQNEAQKKRDMMLKNGFAKSVTDVLKSPDSQLPADPRTVARIATYMKGAIQNNLTPEPAEIAKVVYNDYINDFRHFAKEATPEQILNIIGEDNFKKLRVWDIERIKGVNANQSKQPVKQPMRTKEKKHYKTIDQKNIEEYGSLYVFPED